MKNEIKITQYPVISHKLIEAGKNVTKRIEDLELEKQVATVETVKALKDLRAELNKELENLETQRKAIKEGVNKPYLEFEDVYKTEISEKYKSAIDLLKDKIASVENKVKADKKLSVESYFNELCQTEKIDFIKFEKLGIDINLSTTEKKYKEQVYEYVTKLNDDLALIKSTDFEAEILTEYKLSLNVSNAITTVKNRKESEEKETARLKAEQTQNRKNYLVKLGLIYVEITNQYEFNEDIFVSLSDVNDLSKEDFTAKYAEIEVAINNLKSKETKSEATTETENASEVTKTPVSTPLSPPTVETTKEEIKVAQFEVKATMTKLRALGEFMKSNGIEYKNI